MFKLISYHKTPLNRQIKEVIMIRRRDGTTEILNSHSEFNRCHIPRLIVELEEEGAKKERLEREKEEDREIRKIMEQDDDTWEEKKKGSRNFY